MRRVLSLAQIFFALVFDARAGASGRPPIQRNGAPTCRTRRRIDFASASMRRYFNMCDVMALGAETSGDAP
jgi:hypothetical protein